VQGPLHPLAIVGAIAVVLSPRSAAMTRSSPVNSWSSCTTDKSPLVGLLLLIPAGLVGWLSLGGLADPTALDNGQRSTRKQLAAVVRRLIAVCGRRP
jgi:hypothetical protein